MPEYDATIKLLIQDSADEMLRQLGVGPVTEWLNVELQRIQNRRADLVGMTESGELIHIELQRNNDPQMPLRMAEYALAILRRYKRYPHQVVLFVGNGKLTMKAGMETRGMSFRYDLFDTRDLDGERLIESTRLSDNLLAIMTRLHDEAEGIRKILRRIARMEEGRRNDELGRLFAAAEVRSLHHTITEEMAKMPYYIKTSINDKTFGPWIRKGMEQGLEKGIVKGEQKARQETIRFALQQRFGALPVNVTKRLRRLSERKAREILAGLLSGKRLDELFPPANGH